MCVSASPCAVVEVLSTSSLSGGDDWKGVAVAVTVSSSSSLMMTVSGAENVAHASLYVFLTIYEAERRKMIEYGEVSKEGWETGNVWTEW